jgi:hypothetical protein
MTALMHAPSFLLLLLACGVLVAALSHAEGRSVGGSIGVGAFTVVVAVLLILLISHFLKG